MKYIAYTIFEILIIIWFVAAIRKKEKHEIAMSIGAFLYVTLCFESFGRITGLEYWQLNSGASLQYVGIILCCISGIIFLVSVITMKILGKPDKGWEKTTALITSGIFGIIRHPIYFAALVVLIGIFLIKISLISIPITIIAGICFFLSAWYEDKWDEEKFGESYIEYRKQTKLFIPFIY